MGELAVIEKQLEAYSGEMAALLPAVLPVERLIRTVMVSLEGNPTLARAQPMSILRAAMSAAVLGLEVDGVSGQGYLVPFKGRAQFLSGYKGMVTLAARAERTLEGHVIYEGDHFLYDEGQDQIEHRWSLDAPRERVIGAYAKSRSHAFPSQLYVMTLAQLIGVRDRSAGYQNKPASSPWTTDFAAMCRKSAMRMLSKDLPVLPLHLAVALDTQHELGHVASLQAGGGVVVEHESGVTEIIEGEMIETFKATDRPRIAWPDGSFTEPQTLRRYAGLMSRALDKADQPTAEKLWELNRQNIHRLPDRERGTLVDQFAAREIS